MRLKQRLAIPSLATIMAFRMLGLFMILPIFSAHAIHIPGATAGLIGIALGIYGLTQALFQMPFGLLSDRIGRKPIIALGLILFAIGSIIAALSHSIFGLIFGRAIQGMGAIGSATLAFAADLTREKNRSKAMAFIGLTIGLSFAIAMVIAPAINHWFHLSGIFWLTAVLALIGLAILCFVPHSTDHLVHSDVEVSLNRLSTVFKNRQLLRLDFGIFSLHLILTALFIAIPILFTHVLNYSQMQQSMIYFIVLLLAFFTMVPFMILAEKKQKMKQTLMSAIFILFCTQVLLYFFNVTTLTIEILLFFFFTAFTLLEACLPSLISKIAPAQFKGTAMGVYSTSQFFGIFVGGSLGGIIYAHFGLPGIFAFCACVSLGWLLITATMQEPSYNLSRKKLTDTNCEKTLKRLL